MIPMNPYFYRIELKKVLDGDTIDAAFDLGFNITNVVRVRCMGYDAPETWRPSSEKELEAGIKVKEFFAKTLADHAGHLYCQSTNIDLYGRSSGIIYFKNPAGEYVSINDIVVQFIADNHLNKSELK
jgi:endonuclease YncB( thermonuclease family)